ncbi:hypothetical protein BJX68DRAFT_60406 [Aspergillus pseudodeflectus]|uniref:Uncharacterized protein n=1 Tax=Aspergillus pseudodeflectus TaxID=176178 RepID=A0ABR4KIR3_9EURO
MTMISWSVGTSDERKIGPLEQLCCGEPVRCVTPNDRRLIKTTFPFSQLLCLEICNLRSCSSPLIQLKLVPCWSGANIAELGLSIVESECTIRNISFTRPSPTVLQLLLCLQLSVKFPREFLRGLSAQNPVLPIKQCLAPFNTLLARPFQSGLHQHLFPSKT